MKGKKPVIGITGGIASGKSLAARILAELGAGVIDADELNHQVLHRDTVRRQVQERWGRDIYDAEGRLNRRKLADIVFRDEGEKAKLEALTHPLINELRGDMIQRYESDDRIGAVVLDTPLLFEVGQDRLCDAILFVEADQPLRAVRVQTHRGWDEDELQRRENLQKPLDNKRRMSDYIVVNNSDIDALRQRLKAIYQLVTST